MERIQKALRDSAAVRWSILLLVSYIMAANYYFYDALVPLKTYLQLHLNFSSEDYGWVEGFYSFPNTFLLMAVIGGMVLDKIGIRITGFMFVIFMFLGAMLTAYAATDYFGAGGLGYDFMNSFLPRFSPQVKMMALGMLLFGLGAETSIVVANKTIVKWFKGKEVALAMAINLSIARIGTALALFVGPRLAHPNWTKPIWLAAILISIGVLVFFIYMVFDYKLDKQVKEQSPLLDKEEEFHVKDLLKLITDRSFIFITALCLTFYAAVFPFLKFSVDFFQHKYNVSNEIAGEIAFWLPFGTVLFTPLFGAIVDKKGKAATFMIYGSLTLVLVHLLFAFTTLNPYVLVAFLGIAFSLVPAAMWPSVAKIVSENKLGTAYGTMASIQNLGMFAIPIIAGIILDKTNPGVTAQMMEAGKATLNYTPTMIMFSCLGILGLIFAFLLKREDSVSHYGLDKPSGDTVAEKI